MENLTYNQLINQTLNHYMQGEYDLAYDYITENAHKVNGNEAQIYNFRYSIACKSGQVDLALALLKEAVIEKGFWYSCSYLMEDDDLSLIRATAEFEEILELCRDRENIARNTSKPEFKIIFPKESEGLNENKYIIALHGNQENAAITKPYWESCLELGYTLALLQSSQIEFSDAYCWDNLEKSADELKSHCNILKSCENEQIIGGFSAGAQTALYAVLNDLIKPKALILVAPWLPEINNWESKIDQLKEKNCDLTIFGGTQDEDCLEDALKFVEMLKIKKIPHVFKLIDGLDHDYPTNFEVELELILKRLNSPIKDLKIQRPKREDTERINEFFVEVLRDTFAKNGLDELVEDLSEEIETKKAYLERDFNSDGKDLFFLIAKIDDTIVGSIEYGPANEIIATCADDEIMTLPEIGTVFVHPEYQAMGIGSAMLGAISEHLKDNGTHAFCLDSGYPTARKIWLKKLGDPTYTLKDYWGIGLDHMIWRVNI